MDILAFFSPTIVIPKLVDVIVLYRVKLCPSHLFYPSYVFKFLRPGFVWAAVVSLGIRECGAQGYNWHSFSLVRGHPFRSLTPLRSCRSASADLPERIDAAGADTFTPIFREVPAAGSGRPADHPVADDTR